jgi:hypothetical protein
MEICSQLSVQLDIFNGRIPTDERWQTIRQTVRLNMGCRN